MKNLMSSLEMTTSPVLDYITLKSAIAPKIGKHADGCINYTAACDYNRTKLFVTITHNSSGGYFSREYVSVNRIEELLAKLDQPTFPSNALKAAFTGRSSNNAGFLAAILHAEGLLSRAADSETKHVSIGDWTNWKTSLLRNGVWESPAQRRVTQKLQAEAARLEPFLKMRFKLYLPRRRPM